ncbi:hypothetical protein [Streptomyces rubellomurinus]|uniref:hypothetical protein n=1 Tax=Streptomyces rubellomurinus (strain ATCC 31215) TaxID=359131 RepID=UPI00069787C3|nr:hypothetical protein [Streptomyces rubellomurinus]
MGLNLLHRGTALGPRLLTRLLLQAVTAAALAVDAAVHADLAPDYDFGPGPTQGTLFRVEAAAACLAALLVLFAGRRFAVWAFAFLVSASALGAVLLYSHVDVGALGPLPNMYDPVWYPQKTASAVAEAVGTAAALAGLLLSRPPRWGGRWRRRRL